LRWRILKRCFTLWDDFEEIPREAATEVSEIASGLLDPFVEAFVAVRIFSVLLGRDCSLTAAKRAASNQLADHRCTSSRTKTNPVLDTSVHARAVKT
jgi:hypothetical protein